MFTTNESKKLAEVSADEVYFSSYHILGYKGYGRCVNIWGTTAASGNSITLYDWDNNDDQLWSLKQIGMNSTGEYTFVLESAHSGLYLGYTGVTDNNNIKYCNVTNQRSKAEIVAESLDVSRNLYRFKMYIDNTAYYLTPWAGVSRNTSKLLWMPERNNTDQSWKAVSGTTYPAAHSSARPEWRWPTPESARINDGYNSIWREYNTDPTVTNNHVGLDLSAGNGYCYSMFDGTIKEIHTKLSNYRGRYVDVQSDDGTVVRYQHLASINVSGSTVSKGDIIGVIGGSGTSENTYGVHLHFEINNGNTDPLTYFD